MYLQEALVPLGKTANLVIELKGIGQAPRPAIPNQDHLRFVYAGREQRYSQTNGRRERLLKFNFKIVPSKPGNYTIGPLLYPIGQKKITLPAVQLNVVEETEQSASSEDLLFAKTRISKQEVTIQEVFDLILEIYYRDVTLDNQIDLLNSFDDALKVERFEEIAANPQHINGQVYKVRAFRAKARAVKDGVFDIAPVLQAGIIQPRQQRRNRFDPFADFMRRRSSKATQLRAAPATLTARKPPTEGQPDSYEGAVGNFDFQVHVGPLQLKEGDPITVRTEISGIGNIDLIRPKEIAAQPHLKTYNMQMENSELNDSQTAGKKVFKQVIIPQSTDIKEVGPFLFSFYNPDTRTYKEIKRGPFLVTVQVSEQGGHSRIISNGESAQRPSTPTRLGDDLIYLKPLPKQWKRRGALTWYQQPWFKGLQTVPLLGMLAAVYFQRRRTALQQNEGLRRRQHAPKAARAGLQKARDAISAHKVPEFYEGIWEALTGYMGDRFNLPPGDIRPETIAEHLKQNPDRSALQSDLRDWFAQYEAVRYGNAGEADPEVLKKELRSAEDLLKRLEKSSR